MSANKPLVLVLGATGRTGRNVIKGLLESGQYNVAALTRAASASKPEVDALRSQGVEIRTGDFAADPPAKLAGYLEGVEVLLSTVSAEAISAQKPILKAAVDAGVKRIIPCDVGTPGAKGVRGLHDAKLDVRDYLKDLCAASNGVSSYTFLDIGWWMQLAVPGSSAKPAPLGPLGDEYYAEDDKLMLLTDVDHIGPYVARIIGDKRTANQYVVIREDELTLRESREIAEAASGEAEAIRAKRVVLDRAALIQRAAESKAKFTTDGDSYAHATWAFSEYMVSIHFLGENTLANAKKLGALDAQELYPDIVPTRFADFAKEFYGATH
ncbi:uncharacterized protein C8Q71DRAFT_778803 [Rhodofomes roseus]|uniref:NmrA-like domain-containing protein n=1 Tax=Rhodofomes roseus TaxID=34475 RepID=A0A4Y9Z5N1_9APHY|nr:uncharacterized protein C8Q71DRAFT_778803 [Rhodofomes roseus]KAH9831955.1 hypothetical protein C8Q71DRAFT_778803 [Rhodofomes roseus]TFY69347.1 hypothetical protein EVJ58_g476 [Rhodofomes roseus]